MGGAIIDPAVGGQAFSFGNPETDCLFFSQHGKFILSRHNVYFFVLEIQTFHGLKMTCFKF